MSGLRPIPDGVVTLDDHEAHARTTLDANAWAYFAGAAADEQTLAANRSAWSHLQLLPRVLRPLAGGHTRVTLLGRELAHPILLAPVAWQRHGTPRR
jgi:4-hydroxymandelate oxidase